MSKGAEAYGLLQTEILRVCPASVEDPGMISALSSVRDVAERHDTGISKESFVAGFLFGGATLAVLFYLSERQK